MKRVSLLATALVSLLGPLSGASNASELPLGCYINRYDKQHLAKHKGQVITSIKATLASGKHLEGYTADFLATVAVTLRNEKGVWDETADCTANGQEWKCGIECDGGGFTLKTDAKGLTLINVSGFRVAKDGCGENTTFIEATPGNRMFRLAKAKLAACK